MLQLRLKQGAVEEPSDVPPLAVRPLGSVQLNIAAEPRQTLGGVTFPAMASFSE